MHGFHDAYNAFPQAAAFRSPEGKPLLSWRVAMLPYIGEQNLYMRFKLDEPWDSPNNIKLLPMMPKTYLQPGQLDDGSGMTHYQVFVGPGTVFDERVGQKQGNQGPGMPQLSLRLVDIIDGTSNTILIATATNPVPWTKPEDIPFDPMKPLPPLGGLTSNGFNVAFADGSVRFIPQNTPEASLKAMITFAGGEVVPLP